MSAGTGIWHSEMNPRHDRDVHFVQMWVPPDTERIGPGYEQLDINAELAKGGLVPIASGRGHAAAISIRQGGPSSGAGGSSPARRCACPTPRSCTSSWRAAALPSRAPGLSQTGDAARLTEAGARALTADSAEGAEVLIWETHGGAGGRLTRHRAVSAAIEHLPTERPVG